MPRGGKHVPTAVSSYRDSPTPQNNTLLQELYHLIHRVQVCIKYCLCVVCATGSLSKKLFITPVY